LTEADLPRAVWNLAWPVVLEATFFGLGGIINTILVGRLGAPALAAVGLGQQVEFMIQVIFAAVTVGVTAIVSRHIGASEPHQANLAVDQSIIMAVLLGILFTLPVWIFAEEAMVLLRAKPEVVKLGAQYIRIVAFSFIPGYVLAAGSSSIRGTGNTRTPMVVILSVTVCNIIFGYLLIYGGMGFPALGVRGAGIAGLISRVIGAIAILRILIKGCGPLQYSFSRILRIDMGMTRRIVKIGLPAGLEQLQLQAAMTIYATILSSLGTLVFAAHSITMRIENLAFMPGFGFGMAAMALVGQSLGAKRADLGQKASYISQKYAIISMTSVGTLLFFFGRHISFLFISNSDVIALSSLSLKIWAFAMPMMATSNTLAGGLRGAGDTRWVLLIMAFCIWLLRLPLAFFLAISLGLGAVGAWAAAVFDINVRGAIIWRRFASGLWKNIQI
jgi:putative MATE family efflux protein